MSEPKKKRDKNSIKPKNQSQKSAIKEQSYNGNKYSKQIVEKQSDYNSFSTFQQNSKKYPKSPFLKKIKNQVIQEVDLTDFQEQLPTQYIKKQSLRNRFFHKKGGSMDFQLDRIGFTIGQRELQRQRQISQNQKIIINNKLIQYLKARNSQSEIKDYQQFNKFYIKSKQTKSSSTGNHKCGKPGQNKTNNKKNKLINSKFMESNEDYTKMKKHSLTSKQSNKLSVHTNSGDMLKGLKGEFRSMQLTANPKNKVSLRDKKITRNSRQLKNNLSLAFPSKLNSLYSNTTSLFSSKTEFQPFINCHTFRIPTEEPQNEIIQIRKFQSLALTNKATTKQSYRQNSLIRELSEQIFCIEEKTEDIIRNYIKREVYPQSQSLIIQSGNSLQEQLSRVLDLNQLHRQQKKQTLFQHQYRDKFEDVIKLISQTNSLGEEKKQLLLTKIREIIPLAKIGSKEIQRQASIEMQTSLQQNGQTPTQSLKSSFIQNECIEILNIKLLDQTLRERQQYLKERLQKQIKRLQDRKQMAIEDFKSEKNRLKKWINSQIKETNKTRLQLWKGFSVANKLLQNKSQDDFKKDEMFRCVSQKILRNNKSKAIQKQEIQFKQQKKKTHKQQTQLYEPFTEEAVFENGEKYNQPQFIKQQFESIFYPSSAKQEQSQSVQKSEQIVQTTSFRKNYIFVDSAQKIDYDFDDTSPILKSPHNYHNYADKNLFQQLSVEVLDHSLYEQNSDKILIQQLSPTNSLRKLTALSDQDKEDIIEFIFLDLCVQIQDENQMNSRIIKKIDCFIKKLKERAKRPRGFKTNPQVIKEYLKNFISFLNNHPHFLNKIHQQIDKQLGPTSLQILRYLHPISNRNNQEEDIQPSVVLDIELFQTFQKEHSEKIEISHYYDDEAQEKRRKAFLRNSMHIHNKAIFDAFNQQLDKIRPYGHWGKPFEWKTVAKFQHQTTSQQKNALILKSFQATINMGHYMCGFMMDKEQCSFKDNLMVTEADIQQIKSNRLNRVLADYMEELEQKLMFIDDQEVELLVGVQQFIFDTLLAEMINFIQF